MGRVVIGMDPHKRSATIEVINSREKILDQGRFGTDRDGYRRPTRSHAAGTNPIQLCRDDDGVGHRPTA